LVEPVLVSAIVSGYAEVKLSVNAAVLGWVYE
jgi:hypothetical protein